MKRIVNLVVLMLVCSTFISFKYYPIDGYEHTGIKRLKRLELIKSGEIIKIAEIWADLKEALRRKGRLLK